MTVPRTTNGCRGAARLRRVVAALSGAVLFAASAAAPIDAVPPPQTVHFPATDGRTELIAYRFVPASGGPHPAIVMLHGRGGPYSANVNVGCDQVGPDRDSPCNAATLSKRHAMWGRYWAQHGYIALLVDSFGPRGRAHGYGRHTHADPHRDAVNERTVRPLDAEAALAWLAAQPEVRADRVMLQGWSNGGSTALNTMYRQARQARDGAPIDAPRFRGALVFYPGCGPRALISERFVVDASVSVFLGADDEEVSPTVCARVLGHTGGPIEVTTYPGATHDFDDPGAVRQGIAGNRAAKHDTMTRAARLLEALR